MSYYVGDILFGYDEDGTIEHYGVKGQKWGVINEPKVKTSYGASRARTGSYSKIQGRNIANPVKKMATTRKMVPLNNQYVATLNAQNGAYSPSRLNNSSSGGSLRPGSGSNSAGKNAGTTKVAGTTKTSGNGKTGDTTKTGDAKTTNNKQTQQKKGSGSGGKADKEKKAKEKYEKNVTAMTDQLEKWFSSQNDINVPDHEWLEAMVRQMTASDGNPLAFYFDAEDPGEMDEQTMALVGQYFKLTYQLSKRKQSSGGTKPASASSNSIKSMQKAGPTAGLHTGAESQRMMGPTGAGRFINNNEYLRKR
jgi:hypothetical protein